VSGATIELRPCESDAELEAWRSVRIAVVPYERTDSVEEIRRGAAPEQLMLLAYLDGELAGSGVAGRGDTASGYAIPRVLPEQRRRGVGTALLFALAEHVQALGFPDLGVGTDDEGSLAFARHFGFEEVGRQIEQVRAIGSDEAWPRVPDGVEIVSLAKRPELRARTYHELALAAFDDIPTPRKIEISLEDWERGWITALDGSFAALAGDEVVGCAGLILDTDRPDRAENSLTAVRRDWRGRGVARALKETVIAWASANDIGELYTWTQTGNENMRTVNEKLGYVTGHISISLRRQLPLPAREGVSVGEWPPAPAAPA
jgi:GNAT superfamily N-acetyltransferase